MKVIRICIIGYSNTGKSTFLNRVIGSKVSIVTRKINTTRDNIIGVLHIKDSQLVFTDTPGFINKPKSTLEKKIGIKGLKSLINNDIVCIFLDIKNTLHSNHLINMSYYSTMLKTPVVVLNKIDLIHDKTSLIKAAQFLKDKGFDKIFMISSLKNQGINDVINYFIDNTYFSDTFYSKNITTDNTLETICQEITREKLFMFFHEEIPYFLTVKNSMWKDKAKSIVIYQDIIVTKNVYKKILLGKSGNILKKISQQVRYEIKKIINKEIHLYLFIKVEKNWINKF